MRLLMYRLAGFMAIFIGISIVVSIIDIDIGYDLLGPLFLFGIGSIFYVNVHRLLGIFVFLLGFIPLFMSLFNIDVAGIIFAFLFIYIGYRLFTGKMTFNFKKWRSAKAKRKANEPEDNWGNDSEEDDPEKDWIDEEIKEMEKLQSKAGRTATRIKTTNVHNSLIGDVHLINQQFELNDMNISYAIGDIKIDLSKAIIPEGESVIAISGIFGDVDIYVPPDLDVSVTASITLGNYEILGYKQSGINRQIQLATKGYKQSTRKVKISVSLFLGDVDVRFL